MDSLTEANRLEGPAGVPNYQLRLAHGETPIIISPLTGQELPFARSYICGDRVCAVEFGRFEDVTLFSKMISLGYPIGAAWIPSHDLMLKLDDPVWGVTERDVLAAQNVSRPPVQNGPVTLCTGDPNFAHCIWNQLPAIWSVLEGSRGAQTVRVDYQPIGPIEVFLQQRADLEVEVAIPTSMGDGESSQLLLGSTRVPRDFLTKLVEACRQRLSEPARRLVNELSTRHGPVVWFSVRSHDRTALNQEDMILALVERMVDEYGRLTVILDGFSIPDDQSKGLYDPGLLQRGLEGAALAIARLSRRLRETDQNINRLRIFELSHFVVPDTLGVASLADFYFVHHGTVQHKVGWTSNAPGIVHSNSAVLTDDPSVWAASMIEGGRSPRYLAPDMVTDDKPPVFGDERMNTLNLSNYSFTRMPETIDFVIQYMTTHVRLP